MACERLRRSVLRAVDGEASPSEALRAARHLSRCTTCRILAARERRLAEALSDIEDAVSVDEGLFHRVMGALATAPIPRRSASVARGTITARRGRRMAFWLLAGSAGALGYGARTWLHSPAGSWPEPWRLAASGDGAPIAPLVDAAGVVAGMVERSSALVVLPIPDIALSIALATAVLVAGASVLVIVGLLARPLAARSPER